MNILSSREKLRSWWSGGARAGEDTRSQGKTTQKNKLKIIKNLICLGMKIDW